MALPMPPEQWALPRALRGETASNVEYIIGRRDTGERWIGSFGFAPIRDPEGTITGAVVTARDITEAKRLGAELEASQADSRSRIAAQDGVQERERTRIARELHDELQQTLAAISMQAAALEAGPGAGARAPSGAVRRAQRRRLPARRGRAGRSRRVAPRAGGELPVPRHAGGARQRGRALEGAARMPPGEAAAIPGDPRVSA
jgi:PAS domain-containing protein